MKQGKEYEHVPDGVLPSICCSGSEPVRTVALPPGPVQNLMDPLLGHVAMGYTDFQYVWKDHRGQFAVLYPPRLAATVKNVIG